ncbi:MAG: ParB/RepB/Spo0J family partition protein [Deltaproteobacteria bacterium]|jgi:ParB family chromosome partitioning protein|nr:ParB/RepB/Spo0J family partition protein [Deltaproteobacteria bacterium]MCW8893449.1 ParB/RepB/Spo0J family partition protein [Deltaproteobacteria bacterium]MCW9050632.1 ParB/RepB/Spo0J family partition protein [Deltaproteobacteria bacterium]
MVKVKRPALGKGIGALLSSAAQEGGKKYFSCPIEELKPHDKQPRKVFDDGKMAELIASIKEKGVIQPLVVRQQADYYQIIAGERRWRAAQKAGLDRVPVVIQDVSEDWALEIALIENIQREDLNPLEEAGAYRYLMDSFDLLQEEVAKRVGKNRSTVANALRLLRLPNKVKNDLMEGSLSMGHARALLALEQDEDIIEASEEVIRKKLSVRETEKLIKKIKNFEKIKPAAVNKPIDPNILALENSLQQHLGTQVKLLPKGKGGRLEISYHDQDGLTRLLDLFGVQI